MEETIAPFEIILYGATGFTGRLVAEALAGQGVKNWALAGRNADKLTATRDELGLPKEFPVLTADATDPASLEELCRRARVVVTTVGPYQKFGSELVRACAETGTDYIDLNGEPVWMKRMIAAHTAAARKSGARIVFSAGFDSIPSDLGVYFLQREARERLGAPFSRVRGRVRRMRGDASGGTMASMKATLRDTIRNPEAKAALADPFALTEDFRGPDQPPGDVARFNKEAGFWEAPFAMAAINTKNIHRTNFLLGHPYGTDFVYDEMMNTALTDPNLSPAEVAKQVGLFGGKSHKAGQGPSREERAAGYYEMVFTGLGLNGQTLSATVTGDADPGYGSTSKMLATAARCLADLPGSQEGGFYTPAALLAEPLLTALPKDAGVEFGLVE